MSMLLTAAIFLALTVLFAALHVRKRNTEAGAATPRCPRCNAALRVGTAVCPECSAPLQAYELVTAPLAREAAAGAPLHAVVRADQCVGCGACISACPEPGALTLVGQIATLNLDVCKGHGQCVPACPVGAIGMGSGSTTQRVEVPNLDTHFQSDVPGLYVVGELGGRGLIKNAVNEGKLAVEHIAKELPPGRPRADGDREAYDVVVVGSGPAGLSAGLEALRAGLRYLVLEQGTLSDTIAKYPRQKLLLAEPVRIPLYGDLWVTDASKEELLQVWKTMIEQTGLEVTTGQRVERVSHEAGMFHVATADRVVRARRVVLAMGRRGTPRRLGVPGEELNKVLYDIVEMDAFAGQRVLVVGGGDSAIESAVGLARQPDTEVTLSYRGTEFAKVKERNRVKLGEAVEQGRVRLLLPSQVREIRAGSVMLESAGRAVEIPNDTVIVRIGGEAPYPFLERMGVRIVHKEIALEAPAA